MIQSNLITMLQCSRDQAETLIAGYRNEYGWHPETVIAAAGALVGHAIQTSAYSMAAQGTGTVTEFERSTIPPFGKFINCGERIQIYINTEFAFLQSLAGQLDWFDPQAMPEMQEIVTSCVDQIGDEWFPRLSVTAEHMPREWSPDAVPRYVREMRGHLDHHGLRQNICDVLCMTLALGHLVSDCKKRLDPSIALRVGLEMAVATANIGNLDRPHGATHFEGSDAHTEHDHSSPELERLASIAHEPKEPVDALSILAQCTPNAVDDPLQELSEDPYFAGILEEVRGEYGIDFDGEDVNAADAEDDAATSQPRERAKLAAFGKR